MLKALDRHRRVSTLFQFTTRRLRAFIDPDHLLIRIDEQLDLARQVAPFAHNVLRAILRLAQGVTGHLPLTSHSTMASPVSPRIQRHRT